MLRPDVAVCFNPKEVLQKAVGFLDQKHLNGNTFEKFLQDYAADTLSLPEPNFSK